MTGGGDEAFVPIAMSPGRRMDGIIYSSADSGSGAPSVFA